MPDQQTTTDVKAECTGRTYPVNPDAPDEGSDVHHDGPCPVHPEHTLTLMRDDDRMGGRYGQHYYVERMGVTTVKVEDIHTFDRVEAHHIAWATAKLYGARLIDRRPDVCLYGWSS